ARESRRAVGDLYVGGSDGLRCAVHVFVYVQASGGRDAGREQRRPGHGGTAAAERHRQGREIMLRRAAAMLALAIACSSAGVLAQSAATYPDLSGYWELRYDSFNV